MKTCCVCGTQFAATRDKSGKCQLCKREYDRKWRDKRRVNGKKACGSRMPREYEQAREEKYRQRPEVKARLRERARARYRNPLERHKHEARWQVNRAVASGRLIKKPCAICGSSRSQAHHPDYSKPLDVVWLCAKHHAAEHARAEGKEPDHD